MNIKIHIFQERKSTWRGEVLKYFDLNVQKETVEIESPAAIHKYSYKRMLLKSNNEVI